MGNKNAKIYNRRTFNNGETMSKYKILSVRNTNNNISTHRTDFVTTTLKIQYDPIEGNDPDPSG